MALSAVGVVALTLVATMAGAGSGPVRIGSHGPESGVILECADCHESHGGPRRQRGIGTDSRSAACLACHGNTVTFGRGAGAEAAPRRTAALARNIQSAFEKVAHHPLGDGSDRSRRTMSAALPRRPEDLLAPPGNANVGCTDCHSPHGSAGPAAPGGVGLRAADGAIIDESALCYRCHGSSRVADGRRRAGPDIESLMTADSVSSHPVETWSSGSRIPGLIAPAGTRRMTCSDCHGNDDPAGPRGPHGSANEGLLVLPYDRRGGAPEAARSFALCWSCHDRETLLGEGSRFPSHRRHVVDGQEPCVACHDAHGSRQYPHLVSFDRASVTAGSLGAVTYEAAVTGSGGSCTLRCHDHDHVRASY